MSRSARITGLGLITPLGGSAGDTWRALLAGHFIDDHARARIEVPSGASRVLSLARAAAREAVAGAGWSASVLGDDATALVVGTSKGPVETWLTAPPELSDVEHLMRGPIDPTGLAEITSFVAKDLRLGFGSRLTLSAACASGLHALIRAVMMIRTGQASRALVVAAEASVHPLFIDSFRRLGVLPRPGIGCRPFDLDRDGFLMSEAAAAVCLEAGDHRTGSRTIATVDGFGLGGDARHLTAGDPDAVLLRRLLARIVRNEPIDLIHAHGTGTPTNDPTELAAIEAAVVPDGSPANVYSHKGALGHSLGAAGLVAVVINCLSARDGIVPPNVQTRRPLPAEWVRIAREAVPRPIHRSLACAAGFGGPVAVVGLRHS